MPDGTQQERIWLMVRSKLGFGMQELLPFKIIWAERSVSSVAQPDFLFPLGVLHAIKEPEREGSGWIRYFPEGEGEKIRRIKSFTLWLPEETTKNDNKITRSLLDRLRTC
ncbi:MAG: hypothetical protein GY862_00945 [Gammaproteobacteria bacterium]|nr:hypothetical protein [Gammaproteobacteria bacterium]